MGLNEIGYENADWIRLAQGALERSCVKAVMNSGFHKGVGFLAYRLVKDIAPHILINVIAPI
jgi:hypothetical protein